MLQLPDGCLLAVLRCHAHDARTLFSAARTHSRLRRAAAMTVSSIQGRLTQQQVNSMLLYLSHHGEHITSIDLMCSLSGPVQLMRLPKGLQLHSLCLEGLHVQVHKEAGSRGVLQAGAPLTRLLLRHCCLLDSSPASLEVALQQLPKLQHLIIDQLFPESRRALPSPSDLLQHLQELTYLELHAVQLKPPRLLQMQMEMQLEFQLQDLRLELAGSCSITAGMMAGMRMLTSLRLKGRFEPLQSLLSMADVEFVDPSLLVGMPQLQHLSIHSMALSGADAVAGFMSELQQLQQLTHLSLSSTFSGVQGLRAPPAETYAGLIASSKLQHLEVSNCVLPPKVWRSVLPAGRQLPQMRQLRLQGSITAMGATDVARLVGCCPNLQVLHLPSLSLLDDAPAEVLGPLGGLTGLQELSACDGVDDAALGVLAQLTGLTRLDFGFMGMASSAGLLPLTGLRQLKRLSGAVAVVSPFKFSLVHGAKGKPVWYQLLQCCIKRSVPGALQLAQQEGVI